MTRKNLFSKIVAGIGTLAMVATMLPAMATTAEARSLSYRITAEKHRADRHYMIAYLNPDTVNVEEGVNPNGTDVKDIGDAFVGSVEVKAADAAKDQYLLLVPDKYYTFNGRPTGPKVFDWDYNGADANPVERTINAAGVETASDDAAVFETAKTQADLADAPGDNVRRGEDVWVQGIQGNGCEIIPNGTGDKYPDTYLFVIHGSQLKNDTRANKLSVDISDAVKEVVSIIIKTGDNVDADVVSLPNRSIGANSEVRYDLTINDDGDGILVNNTAPSTTRWVNNGALTVIGDAAPGHLVSATAGDNEYDQGTVAANGTVPTTAGTDATAQTISVSAGKSGGGNLSITVNGVNYDDSELVTRNMGFQSQNLTKSYRDMVGYVEMITPTPTAGDGDAASDATAVDAATDVRGLIYPDPTTTDYSEQTTEFAIWYTALFNLYFDGPAMSTSLQADGTWANTPTVTFASAKYRAEWLNKNPKYKVTTIELGTQMNKGNVVFRNGEQLTENIGIASYYNRSFVFRDENGKRFDLTENAADTSLSADPPFHWLRNQTEGSEVKFTVEIDPMYKKTSNFGVWIVPVQNNDTRTDGGLTNGAAVELFPDENGVYTAKLGGRFPYAIYADGVAKKTGKDLREVVNQPEADAKYSPDAHGTVGTGGAVTGGEEVHHTGINRFPFYRNSFFATWMDDSCNVAEPRYMLYLEANEEDTDLVKVFPFAAPRAVATTNNDYIGTDFPIGDYKMKIRFSDTFVGGGHGDFDDSTTNDRYAAGPDFKVTIDGAEATADANGLYDLKVTEGEEPIVIKVDGIVPAYRVYAPNVSAYDIEANVPMNRETADNFVSSVIAGEKYRFKINFDEGVSKGPNFKVELAQVTDPGSKGDYSTDVVRTQIPEGKDGWYEFTVNNDTQIIISGIIGGEGFSDLGTTTSEEQAAINWLKDKGMQGYGDGTFRPDLSTTRAQFVRMLCVLKNGTAGTASFSDTNGHWAAGEIGWASGEKFVEGYPDGTFKPDMPIRRSEVAQIIWKMAGSQGTTFVAPFPDVNQGDWFAPAINWNFSQQIIQGYTNGNFGPNDPIKRAHIALMLYRANGQY